MPKRGDIIFVQEYIDDGKVMSRHSFIVIDDDGGKIQTLDYDFIALVMSSFKSEEQKQKKLSYGTNFPITGTDETNKPAWAHGKEGYIKAEQFYFFNKSKTQVTVIGQLTDDVMTALITFIDGLVAKGVTFREITDNL